MKKSYFTKLRVVFLLPTFILLMVLSGCEKDPEIITETITVYVDTCLVDTCVVDTSEIPVLGIEVGTYYGGGIVFYVDETGEHGLICALNNGGPTEWGCSGTVINGADGIEIGTGEQNSIDILNNCSDINMAAYHCDNYSAGEFVDWYLPSKNELNEISLYRVIIAEASMSNGGTGFGDDYYFWSSTEVDDNEAWSIVIGDNGSQFISNKGGAGKTRAIRAF